MVIPFAKLKPTWDGWREQHNNWGGFFFFKEEKFFRRRDVSSIHGETGAVTYFDADGKWSGPTADNSIIAFWPKKDDPNDIDDPDGHYEFIDGIVIEVTADSPVYFGVIDQMGLVHLRGEGKCTMPDGTVKKLK